MLVCVSFAFADNGTVLFEGNFSNENFTSKWKLQAPAEFKDSVLKTEGKLSLDQAIARSKEKFYLPGSKDDYLLNAEWEFTPTEMSERGQGFGFEDGGFFVSTFWSVPMLNDVVPGNCKLVLNRKYKMSCVFNRYEIFSWKIDGKEQLSVPVQAFRAGANKSCIQIQDYWDVKSKTKWYQLKISKVALADMLSIRLSKWYQEADPQKPKPAAFLLGNATSMEKIFQPISEYRGQVGQTVSISAAGRERESFQVVVMPLGKSLKQVDVKITDFLHSDGKTHFPAENISWSPVGYVKTVKSGSAYQRIGWMWPDILLPAKSFDVAKGNVQPVWFTVNVPADTKPGRYRGLINIQPEGVETEFARVELTVQPYSLPLRGKLKTAFSFRPEHWESWYKPEEYAKYSADKRAGKTVPQSVLPPEAWRKVYDFLLAYRISPTCIYSYKRTFPFREDMEYCYKRGMNATCLNCFRGLDKDPKKAREFLADIEQYLQDWEKFVKEKNWPDFTWYVHGFDESEMRANPQQYDYPFNKTYGMIGEKFPWLKRETANPVIKRYYGLVDIWCPVTRELLDSKLPEYYQRQKEGEEVWAYVCCGPRMPFANYFIDCPGVDPRVLGWQFYQYHLTGKLYYMLNLYTSQVNYNKNAPKWPDVPWNPSAYGVNGDGFLMYPGRDMTPLASTRLANIRDGIEDYEALGLLADLADRLRENPSADELLKKIDVVLKVRPEVSESFTKYTKDPQVILKARAEIDSLIGKAMQTLKTGDQKK